MVQRFSEGDEGMYPDDNGPLVEYEDYAALEKLLEWVCLNFNLYDLPPCAQRDKLEELGML